MIEPLAHTISLAHPKGLIWKHLEAHGDWAIRFPANDGVVFAYLSAGVCMCQVEDGWTTLREGDFAMLARPKAWVLANDERSPPVNYAAGHPTLTRIVKGEGPATSTFGGRFVFDDLNSDLVKSLLPAFTLIRGADESTGRLGAILALLGDEAKAGRPGRDFVLERLMELLLTEIIRRPQAAASKAQPGLLNGLCEPRIAKALRALHADVARPWTVGDLAAVAGMSRSSFAAHFASTVGVPPIDYLLNWRMALAKDGLRNGRLTLAKVAQEVGYGSVSSFSTAFKRSVGCSPSHFASADLAYE
jgi:AraC-like DNA-binding protein